MSIDPNITFQSYVRGEVEYAGGKGTALERVYQPEDLDNQSELDGLNHKKKALVEYDPFGDKASEFLSWKESTSPLLQCGFFPTPALINAKGGKWYNWIGVTCRQLATKLKFFVLTNMHPDAKVREDAKMIQTLFKEMHNGALALTYGIKQWQNINVLNKINTTCIINADDGISPQFWNYRMNKVCKAILKKQDLAKISLPKKSNEIPSIDFHSLNSIHSIHGQSLNFYTDLRPLTRIYQEQHGNYTYTDMFVKESHRPTVEYIIASQQLYEAVHQAAQNFNASRKDDFNEVRSKLVECTTHYQGMIDALRKVNQVVFEKKGILYRESRKEEE